MSRPPVPSPTLRAVLLALFVTFLWSTSWVIIRWGLDDEDEGAGEEEDDATVIYRPKGDDDASDGGPESEAPESMAPESEARSAPEAHL